MNNDSRISCQKKKGFLLGNYFLVIFMLMLAYILIPQMLPKNISDIKKDELDSLLIFILFIVVMIGMSLRFISEHHLSYIDINDEGITIFHGGKWKKYIVPNKAIHAKNLYRLSSKGFSDNIIELYLNNGYVIRSNYLFYKDEDAKKVYQMFDYDEISGFRLVKRITGVKKDRSMDEIGVVVENNLGIIILKTLLLLFIVSGIVLVIVL